MGQQPLADIRAAGTSLKSRSSPAIVNSSDDAIVGKTPEGMITSWNTAGRAHLRIPARRRSSASRWTILCPPDRAGEIREILETIGRGERVVHFETGRRRKDGTTFPVSVTVSPIYDEHGTLIGASSIARDITEQLQFRATSELRRRADDLERANQNLESFTYSVAHDLRAPLRAMGGFSGALLDEYGDVLGEVGRGYAERIQVRQRSDVGSHRGFAAALADLASRGAFRHRRSRRGGRADRRGPAA